MKALNIFKDWQDVLEYHAGDLIFAEQDPADALFFILSGEVELQLHGEPLGVESAGAMIGETAMIGSQSRSGTATARNDVRLARLDVGQLRELMRKDANFALHVMSGLANRLRAVDAFISTHIGRKS
jgi:CRP-like cAMP-binding protein